MTVFSIIIKIAQICKNIILINSYLIKENQIDVKIKEYKVMKEFSENNYFNNKIIVLRVQITGILRFNFKLIQYNA